MQLHTRQEIEELFAPHMPEQYAREHNQKHLLSQWWPRYQEWADERDRATNRQSLHEIFLIGNTEDRIIHSHRTYLVDRFKVGVGHEYPGVDRVTA